MNASGKWLVVAAVVVVGIGGGVLLLRNTNPKSQIPNPVSVVSPTPEVKVETTGKTVEVTVEGSNYKFSPATITAKKGDTVKLTFKNAGGMHDFVIDEFSVKTNQIGEGEEEDVEFVADKTGTFEYYCSVGNHRKMGMVGKLIVE